LVIPGMFSIPGMFCMPVIPGSPERPTPGVAGGLEAAAASTGARVVVLINSTFAGARTTLPRMTANASTNPEDQAPNNHNRCFSSDPFIPSRLGVSTPGWGA
jgi:hypothetical protein